MSLWWNVIKTLWRQHGSSHIVCIVSWLEFARNIAKFNADQTICNVDKNWSKFTKWTIWISLYCLWLKFFKNISSNKKELLMETYVESLKGEYNSNPILSWSEFHMLLIKIEQCFLNGQYRSNHIVCEKEKLLKQKKKHKTLMKTW